MELKWCLAYAMDIADFYHLKSNCVEKELQLEGKKEALAGFPEMRHFFFLLA